MGCDGVVATTFKVAVTVASLQPHRFHVELLLTIYHFVHLWTAISRHVDFTQLLSALEFLNRRNVAKGLFPRTSKDYRIFCVEDRR